MKKAGKKEFTSAQFRSELENVLPGYKWTVHRPAFGATFADFTRMVATGIQSSGFNRLSTIWITRTERYGAVEYNVRSRGFGTKTPWLSDYTDGTLRRALRGLQNFYEAMAYKYTSHADAIRCGRDARNDKSKDRR